MANFPVNPFPFVPDQFEIEDGGPNRVARAYVNLSGEPVRAHDEFVLAEDVDEVLEVQDYPGFMQQIRHFLVNEVRIPMKSGCIHPFSIALFKLENVFYRDILFAGNPYDIDGVRVRFVRHDHGLNRRDKDYTRYGWILMLGFPLDYRTLEHVDQAITCFGKMVRWHNPPTKLGYVLVKCLYNEPQTVPRSIVFRQGIRQGAGWSWSVPVYILDWEHPEELFPEHDDIPPGGNPHPMPPALQAEAEHVQAFMDEQLNHHHQLHHLGDPHWDQFIPPEEPEVQGWPAWPNQQEQQGENAPVQHPP